MPRYLYRCVECSARMLFYHTMSEVMRDCRNCGAKEALQKMPSSFSLGKSNEDNQKVGNIVKKSIEDFRTDLEEEKKRLKNEELKIND